MTDIDTYRVAAPIGRRCLLAALVGAMAGLLLGIGITVRAVAPANRTAETDARLAAAIAARLGEILAGCKAPKPGQSLMMVRMTDSYQCTLESRDRLLSVRFEVTE